MNFLEFCSCLSDVLHGTGNRSMKIRIFEKIIILTKFEKMEKKRSKIMTYRLFLNWNLKNAALQDFFWLDDSKSVSQKYLDSITARLPGGPLSGMEGTD